MISATSSTDLWITRPVPLSDPRLRLFCLPHAGSGAAQFRPWVELLPYDVELCPVRLPGRENRLRETPRLSLRNIVDDLTDAIQPVLDRPFAIFGHSMGALIGFELARRLATHAGPRPSHLFVSGRRAPHLPERETPIADLADDDFIRQLAERYGTASTSLLEDPELRAVFLPVLRADFIAVERYTYRPGVKLTCPITALGGLNDERADAVELAGWRDYTAGAFALRRFVGDHFFHQTARQLVVAHIGASLQP